LYVTVYMILFGTIGIPLLGVIDRSKGLRVAILPEDLRRVTNVGGGAGKRIHDDY
jgi:hypothetical protein